MAAGKITAHYLAPWWGNECVSKQFSYGSKDRLSFQSTKVACKAMEQPGKHKQSCKAVQDSSPGLFARSKASSALRTTCLACVSMRERCCAEQAVGADSADLVVDHFSGEPHHGFNVGTVETSGIPGRPPSPFWGKNMSDNSARWTYSSRGRRFP